MLDVGAGAGFRSGSSSSNSCTFGIPWPPNEFVKEALQRSHPFDMDPRVPKEIARAIWNIAVLGVKATKTKRIECLEKYRQLALELEAQEALLHKQLNPEVEKVIKDKKILLFKRMLSDIGFDDLAVTDVLLLGTKIVGELKALGFWRRSNEKLPSVSFKSLLAGAKKAQKEVLDDRCINDPEDQELLWAGTLEEVESGLLDGPLTAQQLEEQVGRFSNPSLSIVE